MGKLITSPRYMIDITGTGSALFGGAGGREVNSEKLEKMRYFQLSEELIGS